MCIRDSIATVPFSDRRSFLLFYVFAEERLSFAEESGDDGHKDDRRDGGGSDIGERLGIEHRRCAKANRQKDCQRNVDPVSYTQLDVYKRQERSRTDRSPRMGFGMEKDGYRYF